MKKFKDFIKPTVILQYPSHGSHSIKKKKIEPTTILHIPSHGSHSSNNIKEEFLDWLNHNDNKHLHNNPRDVYEKLEKPEKHWDEHPEHSEAVKKYTKYSRVLNTHLISRARKELSPVDKKNTDHGLSSHLHYSEKKEEKLKALHLRRKMDKMFNHSSSKLEHDVHVYHGISGWHPGEEAAKGNGRIRLPAYTSTSISKSIAHGFARGHKNPETGKPEHHILHIHLKKGQKGVYAGDHSHFPDEKEMILPRNTTLKIHKTPTKPDEHTHVWHAHVVDD